MTKHDSEHLAALASRLAARRKNILQAWRRAVNSDAVMTIGAELSIAQFYDHIPEVLDAFERILRTSSAAEKVGAEQDHRRMAAGHGLVRWQQGYRLLELMRDWGHLHLLLVKELERDAAAHPELAAGVMPIARVRLTELCNEGISQSALQYSQLEQAEAAGRLADLERAVAQLQQLEQQRAEAWREAAHDLRGNLGVVRNATAVLNQQGLSETRRGELQAMLKKGVDSLQSLLNDLVDLARLEAGHEQRQLDSFDAAQLVRELGAHFQPLAGERNLFLKMEGPDTLLVEGDAIKTRRIAQNLLLNALHYTERGGVKLSWAAVDTMDAERWVLCIQDTGPGFDDGTVPPLAEALKLATDEVQSVERQGEQVGGPGPELKPAPTLASQSASRGQPPGEGVGLSIVKRLCELLDASLELETAPGQGTTFRVSFPRRYDLGFSKATE